MPKTLPLEWASYRRRHAGDLNIRRNAVSRDLFGAGGPRGEVAHVDSSVHIGVRPARCLG